MASTGISLFVFDANGKYQVVTHNLARSKFTFFSEIPVTGCDNPRLPKNSVILPKGTADNKATARITTWIATNDVSNPKPLSPDVLNIEQFDDLVNVLATSHSFRLKRELRGDAIRDAVYDYIKQGPLSFDEFAMVVDYLGFDYGLVKTAMHATMFCKAKGGVRVPPEMGRIEAFCKEKGIWGEMEEIEEEIEEGIKKGMDRRWA